MYNFLDIIKGTPYWVWVIFVYIIINGIQSTKGRLVSLYRLAIMPSVLVLWSLYAIYSKYGIVNAPISLWLLFFIIGILSGYRMMITLNTNVDVKNKRIYLPGSLVPLILSSLFFVFKYSVGVTYALYPLAKADLFMSGFDLTVSGAISGISLGRFLNLLRSYLRKSR